MNKTLYYCDHYILLYWDREDIPPSYNTKSPTPSTMAHAEPPSVPKRKQARCLVPPFSLILPIKVEDTDCNVLIEEKSGWIKLFYWDGSPAVHLLEDPIKFEHLKKIYKETYNRTF